MNKDLAKALSNIGDGIGFAGFFLMIGLLFFGKCSCSPEQQETQIPKQQKETK